MIAGITWLVAFQLLGELLVRLTNLPVPGPVAGMLLLFAHLRLSLRLRRYADDGAVVRAGSGLLRHLQLFFVPAGVGIVSYLAVIGRDALPIAAAMIGSWVLALAAVGWTAVALERLLGRPRDDLPAEAGPR